MDSSVIQPLRQVRAVFDSASITVPQAFGDEIAGAALAVGTFVGTFGMNRMNWINEPPRHVRRLAGLIPRLAAEGCSRRRTGSWPSPMPYIDSCLSGADPHLSRSSSSRIK